MTTERTFQTQASVYEAMSFRNAPSTDVVPRCAASEKKHSCPEDLETTSKLKSKPKFHTAAILP